MDRPRTVHSQSGNSVSRRRITRLAVEHSPIWWIVYRLVIRASACVPCLAECAVVVLDGDPFEDELVKNCRGRGFSLKGMTLPPVAKCE